MRTTASAFCLAAVAVACLVLTACATTPEAPPEKPQMRLLSHKCDQWGVSAVTIAITAPGVVSLEWDNAGVCGTPS